MRRFTARPDPALHPPHRLVLLLLVTLTTACTLPRWPVQGTLSSPFGLRADGLRLGIHRGVDIAVPDGTPVHPMAPGRVAFAGTLAGYGLTVILDHGPRLRTLYAHLGEIRVRQGQHVEPADTLALSGASGQATGPHLHFEILRRGRPVDPVPLLGRPPATPTRHTEPSPPPLHSRPGQAI